MTTNYTTEGMIDEKFGINFGRIKVKENMLKENLTKKPILNEHKHFLTQYLTSK